MRSENIEFPGAHGDLLSARLELPDTPPTAYGLFAHCFTCGKDILAATQICAELTRHGLAVLRFDFTGLGGSDGEFSNTNFSSNIADLKAAANWLRTHHEAPKLLVGHSLGGAAVLAAAGEIAEVKAVATINAPADPSHVTHNFGAACEIIAATGEAEVTLAGRKFNIKKQFLDDVASHRLDPLISDFHAPQDEIVGIENAAQIFAAAKHPKSFISLEDADHLLRRPADARYVAQVLAAWVSRYL